MPPKTYQSAVVVIPPDSVIAPIQEIRRQYDRHFRRWMPHINLIYPFRPTEMFADLLPRFRDTCSKHPLFSITLKEIRYFRHRRENYTLWLHPEPTEELLRLQQSLVRLVPDCDDVSRHAGGFTPHLSIGQVQGKHRMEALLSRLQQKWQSVSFTVAEIYFIRRDAPPNDVFKIVNCIGLGR